MALTKILDKLVQIGPGYLDQTLRTYVSSNRDLKLYTKNDKSYAVIAYYTSGRFVLNETKNVDILLVGGGGGSSIGNLSGGSGAGEVVVVENATLLNGSYVIEVGAGGAGGIWRRYDPRICAGFACRCCYRYLFLDLCVGNDSARSGCQ